MKKLKPTNMRIVLITIVNTSDSDSDYTVPLLMGGSKEAILQRIPKIAEELCGDMENIGQVEFKHNGLLMDKRTLDTSFDWFARDVRKEEAV